MGAALAPEAALGILTLAEAIGIAQKKHANRRDEIWCERECRMTIQSMRINVLTTIREEMRDQLDRIIATLDNMMVVATFMLTFGFGFMVEGTFPPSQSDYGGRKDMLHEDIWTATLWLHVYVVLAALVLICPFFCMGLTLLIRQEVDDLQTDVMGNLQKYLTRTLRSSACNSARRRPFRESLGLRPNRNLRENAVSMGRTALASALGRLMEEEKSGFFSEGELDMLKGELLLKVATYHRFYPWAQIFLWAGVVFGLLLSAVLMGLTMHHNNQNTPWLSIGYAVSISLCAFGSVIVLRRYSSILFNTRHEEDERDSGPWRVPSSSSRRFNSGRRA